MENSAMIENDQSNSMMMIKNEYSFEKSIINDSTSLQQSSITMDCRAFEEHCRQIVQDFNMKTEVDSIKPTAVQEFEELFRETVSSLYSEVLEALDDPEALSQDHMNTLNSKYENLIARTEEILVSKLPNLALEVSSRLTSVKLCLSNLQTLTTADCEKNMSKPRILRLWLDKKFYELSKHVEKAKSQIDASSILEMLKEQQTLQTEIERDGRLLLEAAQRELLPLVEKKLIYQCDSPAKTFPADQDQSAELILDQNSGNFDNSFEPDQIEPNQVVNAAEERRKRFISSLQTRWTRLRYKALEFTLKLEAAAKNKENFSIPQTPTTPFLLDEPPAKRRRSFFLNGFSSNNNKNNNVSTPKPFSTKFCFLPDIFSPVERNTESPDIIPFNANEYEPIMDEQEVENNMNNVHPLNNTKPLPDDNGNFTQLNFDISFDPLLDNGYSSDNNGNGPSGSAKPRAKSSSWSNGSSPNLQRRLRIEQSPIKDYYKMLPDACDTDSEACISLQQTNLVTKSPLMNLGFRNVNSSIIPEEPMVMTDSLVVNLSNSNENLSEEAFLRFLASMEDSFYETTTTTPVNLIKDHQTQNNNFLISRLDAKIREIFPNEHFQSTNWKPIPNNNCNNYNLGQKRQRSRNLLSSDSNAFGSSSKTTTPDEDSTSNDGGSELSADEKTGVPKSIDENLPPKVMMRKFKGRRSLGSCKAQSYHSDLLLLNEMELAKYSRLSYPSTNETGQKENITKRKRKITGANSFVRCTLPRSVSDSEHLSILALCQRSCLCLDQLKSNESNSIDDRLHQSIHENFEVTENQSILLSSCSESQSSHHDDDPMTESPYYEWDDYKPPNHNEAGIPDVKLDDSILTEFGDDYRSWIDSTPSSARRDQNFKSANELNHRKDPKTHMLIVKKSRSQLKLVRRALNSQYQKNVNNLCRRCEKELHVLERFTENQYLRGLLDQSIFDQANSLIKEWQTLYDQVRILIQQPRKIQVQETIELLKEQLNSFHDRIIQSIATTDKKNNSESTIEDILMKIAEFENLKEKIKGQSKVLEEYEQSGMKGSQTALAHDLHTVLEEATRTCENELRSLQQFRDVLVDWKDTEKDYKDTSMRLRERLADCGSFDSLLDGSSSFCSSSIDSSTHTEDLKAIRGDMLKCEERLNRLEQVCFRLADVQSEQLVEKDKLLAECQKQLAEYRRELKDYLAKFAASPRPSSCDAEEMKNFDILNMVAQNSETDASETSASSDEDDESVEKIDMDDIESFSGLLLRKPQIINKMEPISFLKKDLKKAPAMDTIFEDENNTNTQSTPNSTKDRRRSWRKAACYILPIPLCFLALFVGLIGMQIDSECKHNNWDWFFGFKLDYVAGPPPI